MAKKTVDRRARPMAAKVASLAGTLLLAIGRAETSSARDEQSAMEETAGGGLMGAWKVSARAWGFTRSGEPAAIDDTAESCLN
jgi:hypothetical protein